MFKKLNSKFALVMFMGFAISMVTTNGSVALADGPVVVPPAVACGVPFCDIPVELEKFHVMSKGERFSKLSAMHATAKSTDVAVLRNIADFMTQLIPLLQEWNEEGYTIREARALRGESIVGLSKYSPLDGKALLGYYKELSGDGDHFSMITYWKERIGNFEDKTSLLHLMDFFSGAAEISRLNGDSDWVAREARNGEGIVTARLVQLYPYFEGTYRISVKCEGDAHALPSYCNSGFIDRLIIMDTLSSSGLEVAFASGRAGTMVFAFQNVVLANGNTFTATGSPSGIPSQLQLVLDRETGKITGWMKNSDSFLTVQIEGELEATPASVFDFQAAHANKDPLTEEMVTRTYQGQYAGRDVSFTVVSFGSGQFGATMSFKDNGNVKLRFQSIRFFPKLGMMTMVGVQPNSARVKLTVFIKNEANGLTMTGFGFTDLNGSALPLYLNSETH